MDAEEQGQVERRGLAHRVRLEWVRFSGRRPGGQGRLRLVLPHHCNGAGHRLGGRVSSLCVDFHLSPAVCAAHWLTATLPCWSIFSQFSMSGRPYCVPHCSRTDLGSPIKHGMEQSGTVLGCFLGQEARRAAVLYIRDPDKIRLASQNARPTELQTSLPTCGKCCSCNFHLDSAFRCSYPCCHLCRAARWRSKPVRRRRLQPPCSAQTAATPSRLVVAPRGPWAMRRARIRGDNLPLHQVPVLDYCGASGLFGLRISSETVERTGELSFLQVTAQCTHLDERCF